MMLQWNVRGFCCQAKLSPGHSQQRTSHPQSRQFDTQTLNVPAPKTYNTSDGDIRSQQTLNNGIHNQKECEDRCARAIDTLRLRDEEILALQNELREARKLSVGKHTLAYIMYNSCMYHYVYQINLPKFAVHQAYLSITYIYTRRHRPRRPQLIQMTTNNSKTPSLEWWMSGVR